MKKDSKGFTPSTSQLSFLKALLTLEGKTTITALCKASNISRETYYKWRQDKDFTDWLSSNWNKHMTLSMIFLDKIAYNKAGDDFRYWQALQLKYATAKDNWQDTSRQIAESLTTIARSITPKQNNPPTAQIE